ncbi:hypothetical protein Ahy_B06g080041 [Arachis hypogaea]|uniref:Uncharacterized protein n=1 Tax=Arachis hypogaea TaxID=3818 RepID=A0A444YH07_ARAHY|nr:hypothetical protein Ahy_B06g080041 [Arachis hypogaea]
MHILPIKVHHKLLKELANSFKLGKNTLKTSYSLFRVKPSTIGAALGPNASVTDEIVNICVGNEHDRLTFKRIFILYIQMAFLLPTSARNRDHTLFFTIPIQLTSKLMSG